MSSHFLAKTVLFTMITGATIMATWANDLPDFDALWNYNQPAETEQKFRALLPQAKATASYQGELLTQIARCQGLQRKFKEAHQTLDEIKAVLPSQPTVLHVRYLLERGRVFNSSKMQPQAIPLFEQAWKMARELKADFYAVDAAHMLGIAAPSEQQLAWNLKALEAAEHSQEPRARKWLGSLYNNIGWTYHDQKDFKTALTMFRKALAWHQEHQTGEGEAIAQWTVARCLRSVGQIKEALTLQQATLKWRQEKKLPEDGYVSEEIGECLLLLKREPEAQPYFAQAYALLSQDEWLKAEEAPRLERLKQLGKRSD